MILILTASIMYWSLKQPGGELELESVLNEENKTADASQEPDGEGEAALAAEMSHLTTDDAASDAILSQHEGTDEPNSGNGKDEKPDGE